MNRLFSLKKGQEGQATVEFALLLPIFLLLLLGIIEMGFIFKDYIVVSHGAREGARRAALGKTDAEICQVVLDSLTVSQPELVQIVIDPTEGSREKGEPTTVTVIYPHHLIIPVPSGVIPNPITLQGKMTTRIEKGG